MLIKKVTCATSNFYKNAFSDSLILLNAEYNAEY